MTIEQAFWPHVQKGDGCWLWMGSLACRGYGHIEFSVPVKRQMGPHKASWIIHFGEPSQGMCVLHKCDNRACVRPDHLFLGTLADNVQDMVQKGRHSRGVDQHNAKLTEDQVRAIRAEYKRGRPGNSVAGIQDGSLTYLAKKYGVSFYTIQSVINRRTWAHIH